MYKRFLLLISGVLCTLGTFAYSVGDYVFTTDARYKVTGESNLLTNGDFSVANPSAAGFGWTDAAGATLSVDQWQVSPGEGPDGKTALKSLSAAEGVTIFQSVPFTAGQTLLVSFKIKAPTAATSSTIEGAGTYIDVYANADGSANKSAEGFKQVADAVAIGTEWTDVSFAFQELNGVAGSLIITLGRLEAGTLVADFNVQEAQSVYDTRISDRAIEYAQYLINTGEFKNGVSEFQDVVNQMKEISSDATMSEDEGTMTDLLASLAEQQTTFLDQNSANMIGNVTNGAITTSWPNHNNNENWSSYGDWQLTGGAGRWGHGEDVEYINFAYPGAYDLPWGQAAIVKAGLLPGRYMFAVDAMAIKYLKAKINDSYYNADYSTYADYVRVFIGSDSLTYTNVDNRNFNTYTIFGKLAEGDTLKAGIYFPGFGEGNGGGAFEVKNAVLRNLSYTQETVDRYYYVQDIYTQQSELKKRLDWGNECLASSSYAWGKSDLKDSLAVYQAYYDASLVYVDANGNDMGIDIPTDYDDVILAYVRGMNRVRSAFNSLNEPYTTLAEYVPTVEAEYNSDDNSAASETTRTALKSAIDASKSLIANVTATPDSASFASSYDTLKEALRVFKKSCAHGPDSPAEETVINPYFKDNSGQKSGKAVGWELTLQSDSKGWIFFGSDDRFDGEYKAYVSRGHTGISKNKAMQKITLDMKGYYEFRCQAYACNTYKSTYNGMWNGMSGADSVMVTGVHLFFGPENAPDSLQNICTTQTTFGNNVWTIDEVRTYSIYYDKATDADEVVEFGIDALDNKGCNLWGFGGVHVYFWGDKQKYLDGISDVPVDVLTSGSSAVYNLMGVKVADTKANLPKGIYISGGKKFIVK